MLFKRILPALVMAVLAAGCASSPEASDTWSESYLAPLDRVFDAVLDVLEDEDYLVDADRGPQRISAEPSRSKGGLNPSLVIRVAEKSGRIRVDVQTRWGVSSPPPQSGRAQEQVLQFFHELELRLQGMKD